MYRNSVVGGSLFTRLILRGHVRFISVARPLAAKKNSDEIIDPFCDPKNPRRITIDEVKAATSAIEGHVVKTPCVRSKSAEAYGMELYFKKDFLQYTSSFKERGACYCLLSLSDEQKKAGVISASMGNHAQGVCYHGLVLKIPVTVVMPKTSAVLKIQKCRDFKARVVLKGKDMSESKAIAMKMAKDEKIMYVNGYDHPDVVAGQGSIGLEILEQVEKPDAVVVPVGGGGLLAGVSTAIKCMSPETKVIGVESEKCAAFSRAIENNGPTFTPMQSTIAEGLAVPVVGYNAYATAVPLMDIMVVVQEKWIILAILRLAEEEKFVVEGAGACGLAAILSGQLNDFKGKKVVVVLSGGNIDTSVLGRCLERGLAGQGRLIKLKVEVSDRSGGLQELCDIIHKAGVAIKDIMHERAFLKDIYKVEIKLLCEARDWAHSTELKKELSKHYKKIQFSEVPFAAKSNDC